MSIGSLTIGLRRHWRCYKINRAGFFTVFRIGFRRHQQIERKTTITFDFSLLSEEQ